MKDLPPKIRIKDIARLAGVSEGTVDRVLHDRGNVSKKSLQKVEEALKQIDYKPNLYASVLAQKKIVRICCIIPVYKEGDYWESVAVGLRKATDEFSMLNVVVDILLFDQYDLESCRNIFQTVAERTLDGVIFPPFFKEESTVFIQRLEEKEVPYIFLDSNLPQTKALSYFGQDSFCSGQIAAKLLMFLLGKNARIAMFHTDRRGNIGSNQTMERERGFLDYMSQYHPDSVTYEVKLHPVNQYQNIDTIRIAMNQHPDTAGAIIFNSLSYMVVNYLREIGKTDIKLIGYDLLTKNRNCLNNDEINFLIAQQPEQQGYLAVKALSEFLLFGIRPPRVNYMPIDLMMKENAKYM